MDDNDKIRKSQVETFNKFLERLPEGGPEQAKYLGGAEFDALLDNLMFNRVIRLRDLREVPQGNDPGKIYWDGENGRFKIWVDTTDEWADVWFTTGSGMIFGNCYGHHIAWIANDTDPLDEADQNVWYNISDSSIVTGELNGVTHDGDGKLTVSKAGTYLINYSICYEDNKANDHIEAGIEISGSGSANASGISHSENKFASEEEHLSGVAIIELAASATVELAIRTTDAVDPTITVQDINLAVTRIGRY